MSERGEIRVVVLADSLGGGTGNIVLEVIRGWVGNGWNARIVLPRPATARVQTDVPIEVLPSLGWPRFYPVGQMRRLAQVARRLRELQPHIVHAYFFWAILGGRVMKRLGVIKRLVENREDQGFNWGRHEYALLRWTAGLPDRVVCVSHAVRAVVLEREGLDPGRVVVIHNGIDPEPQGVGPSPSPVELRARHGLDASHLVVGMVANFNRPVKGVRYFVEAMPKILAAVPEARFLLLGRGHEEGGLRARMAELGVSHAAVFAGFQTDIGPYYDIMDVSALTSLSEGLSMTLLESMQHGCAVVATRVGGNPELVADGMTGWLVPAKDADAFADRVVSLLRDPERRASMGEAGRRVVRDRFAIGETSKAYRRLYAELLGHDRPQSMQAVP